MSKYSLKEYYKKLLKEAINAAPASVNALPRKHDYQKSKVTDGQTSIPVGKGLSSAHRRVKECLKYLNDSSQESKEITLKFSKQSPITIQLIPDEVSNLKLIYEMYDSYFNIKINKYFPSSYARKWNYKRGLERLNKRRESLRDEYHKVLKEIWERYQNAEPYKKSALKYVGFPGFDKLADDSDIYEADTVNNAIDVLSNIKKLSSALLNSLHSLVEESIIERNVSISPEEYFKQIPDYLKKLGIFLKRQGEDVDYVINIIYSKLESDLGYDNLDDQYNHIFEEEIDYFQEVIPFEKSAIPYDNKDYNFGSKKDLYLKTAIGFLIINLMNQYETAGIETSLKLNPYTEKITPRDVKDSADSRSDLDFDFLTFKTENSFNETTMENEKCIDFKNSIGNSLKIELKDGLARGGSGTFWIAFEQKTHDVYIDSIKKTDTKPTSDIHSKYIFKGTQNKDLFPSDKKGEKSVYSIVQNKVNDYFDKMNPEDCIPLSVVLDHPLVFTKKHDNIDYKENSYCLYYMGKSEDDDISKYNKNIDLSSKKTEWLKSYYLIGKNNEYIQIKNKGLYLLGEPKDFINQANRDLGELCQSKFKMPIMQLDDLKSIKIFLSGSRTGCKWEVFIKDIKESYCDGLEDDNQDFIYEFIMLATLCLSSQTRNLLNENYFNFIIEKLKTLFYNTLNIPSLFNASYMPKGNLLREVYSYLYEGGLGGHMRHPYENLDITPREMMDRIESYGVPQTVIDKVDGQNLFFTVERDGTLLFARNKQDMTHQDLVDKFTGHGAEAAFLEGGEAIKSGVEQWLSSAGNFSEQEILDIFHPSEDIRSFINFEIMHPKKSNQIQYDRKYIVFHSIVDFGEGRSQIFSSNQDERLKKLIGLMDSGVSSTGFELASNREIDLNALSNVQIMVYTDRIRDLIHELEMDEDEFLADGILKIIDKELAQEGISLEENTLKIMRDFVLYGENSAGDAITSRDFTKHISKEDAKKLRVLGLTSATKAKAKVAKILSPFKEIFVDLGIDLLKGVESAYLSPEMSDENIEILRDKLKTAIEDYDQYMMSTSGDELSKAALRLKPHVDKIKQTGIEKAVSTSVEGGVYTQDLDLEKITGGFAPLNQIVGAAYRDKEGIFPGFQDKFLKESKSYSLKSVFKL